MKLPATVKTMATIFMKNTRAPGGMLAEQPHAKSLLISGAELMIVELTIGEFTMAELTMGDWIGFEVCMGILCLKKQ